MMDSLRAPAEPSLTAPATAVAHAWIRAAIYRELESEAIRKRVHIDALAAQIVTAVILLGTVDDIIDQAIASLPR